MTTATVEQNYETCQHEARLLLLASAWCLTKEARFSYSGTYEALGYQMHAVLYGMELPDTARAEAEIRVAGAKFPCAIGKGKNLVEAICAAVEMARSLGHPLPQFDADV